MRHSVRMKLKHSAERGAAALSSHRKKSAQISYVYEGEMAGELESSLGRGE